MSTRSEKLTTFKLLVKNVGAATTPEELKAVFEAYGKVVECQILKDCYAFVHMEDEAFGRNALLMLNGKTVNGNTIGVEESRQKDGPSIPSTRLRVKNVPAVFPAMALKQLFQSYGCVLSVEITGEEAVVAIEAIADVRSVINDLNGYEVGGQKLVVEPLANTAATYNPVRKARLPPRNPSGPSGPNPNKADGWRPSDQWLMRPRAPSQGLWEVSPGDPHSEGRVLRDPYRPGLVSWGPPFHPGPAHGMPPSHEYGVPNSHGFIRARHCDDIPLEPLFFRRHEYLTGGPSHELFSEDDFSGNFEGPPLRPMLPSANVRSARESDIYNGEEPPAKHRVQPSADVCTDGEPFAVPGMIAPGIFRPPRKYFADHPRKKRKKKPKSERWQPPLPPETPSKPVPDFSSYYNMPDNAVLKPFPPPANPDGERDFSEDVCSEGWSSKD